jgi:hypothetical protein
MVEAGIGRDPEPVPGNPRHRRTECDAQGLGCRDGGSDAILLAAAGRGQNPAAQERPARAPNPIPISATAEAPAQRGP